MPTLPRTFYPGVMPQFMPHSDPMGFLDDVSEIALPPLEETEIRCGLHPDPEVWDQSAPDGIQFCEHLVRRLIKLHAVEE
jgi:hypothetical protein